MSKKKHIGKNALSVIIFVFFLIYAISLLYPLVWAFLSSLKTSTEYMWLCPKRGNLEII